MDIRYINPPTAPEGVPVIEPQLMWLRITGPVPAGQASHDAGLAYLADSTLVDHVALPHGHRWHDARLTGTSLDHAMWFHRPTQVDRWVLYDQRVEHTGGARGLVTGHFYTTSGELVATCSQEGLMRWTAGPAS
jgi:acyl-CoA thioesterase-2